MSEFNNTPIGAPQNSGPAPLPGNEQIMAIASIVIGVIGLCSALFLGICAAPFPVIGLVLGYLALKDPEQKNLAIVGMALSGLSLLIVCLLVLITGGLILIGPAIGNIFSEVNQSLQTAP